LCGGARRPLGSVLSIHGGLWTLVPRYTIPLALISAMAAAGTFIQLIRSSDGSYYLQMHIDLIDDARARV
jgi:hypothetical protein